MKKNIKKDWRKFAELGSSSGRKQGELELELATELQKTVKIRPRTATKSRADFDIIKHTKAATRLRTTAVAHARGLLDTEEISVADLIVAIASVKDDDRSVNALVAMIEKEALDDNARKYWSDYYGDYGKMLSREFAQVLNDSKIKRGFLQDKQEWFGRVYGWKSAAVKALTTVLGG